MKRHDWASHTHTHAHTRKTWVTYLPPPLQSLPQHFSSSLHPSKAFHKEFGVCVCVCVSVCALSTLWGGHPWTPTFHAPAPVLFSLWDQLRHLAEQEPHVSHGFLGPTAPSLENGTLGLCPPDGMGPR